MPAERPEDEVEETDSLAFDDLGRRDLAEDEPDDGDEGFSLEELRQTYADVLNKQPASRAEGAGTEEVSTDDPLEEDEEGSDSPGGDTESVQVSPLSIVEALLFVGRPDSATISSSEIAKLMRGVEESDVPELVAQLNKLYAETERALVIEEHPQGYRMTIASELAPIREQFYGRVRSVALNQAAIDCLALIAYQPGISRQKLEEQRGQASGPVLNQLVRRQLIEVHREGSGKQQTLHYYPTEKLFQLAGLASIDDLPQVEEFE